MDIVQESLIGSMLSNLLLVMGMAFFSGGLNRVEQHFNVTVAQTASSLLALAVGSLIIPAAFQSLADGTREFHPGGNDYLTMTDVQSNIEFLKDERITELSRGTAVLLLLVYGAYLLFQLKTHTLIYNAPSPKVDKRRTKVESGDATKNFATMGAGIAATTMGGPISQETPMREPEQEREQPQLSKWVAVFTLVASTACVALCAEFMVDSINAITESGTVSRTFVGLILLPIVGNAAEHATAVTVACKDKMDLAIGVAVGSSMQIALLLIPFIVVLGWILGKDDMNLAFDGFQLVGKTSPAHYFLFRSVLESRSRSLCSAQLSHSLVRFQKSITDLEDCNSFVHWDFARELSHSRRKVALARGRASHDTVYDHCYSCLVSLTSLT